MWLPKCEHDPFPPLFPAQKSCSGTRCLLLPSLSPMIAPTSCVSGFLKLVNSPALPTSHMDPNPTNGVSVKQLLLVKKLSSNAITPSRGSAHAAGYDISSAYDDVVPARGKALIKTDLSIAIPEGTYARLAPRSGLAWKHSIDVGAGVIDADYRGPVGVILFNHSDQDFVVRAGDRIAQLILEVIVTPNVVEVNDLESTIRGTGGFGSTGVGATLSS